MLTSLAALDATGDPTGDTVTVSEVAFDLPIELDIRVDEGGVRELGISPPTQIVETTVMPVFHRLTVRIGSEENRG